jgi:hypothetical protein
MARLWLTVEALAVLAACICLAWYLTNRFYRELHQLAEKNGKGAKFASIVRHEGYVCPTSRYPQRVSRCGCELKPAQPTLICECTAGFFWRKQSRLKSVIILIYLQKWC